jgi:hypothetical protein
MGRSFGDSCAFRVQSVGLRSESDHPLVDLIAAGEPGNQPGGTSDQHDQQALGEFVQSSGMADSPGVQRPFDQIEGVKRAYSWALPEQQVTVWFNAVAFVPTLHY